MKFFVIFGVLIASALVAAAEESYEVRTYFEREEGDYVIYTDTIYSEKSDELQTHSLQHKWISNGNELHTRVEISIPSSWQTLSTRWTDPSSGFYDAGRFMELGVEASNLTRLNVGIIIYGFSDRPLVETNASQNFEAEPLITVEKRSGSN